MSVHFGGVAALVRRLAPCRGGQRHRADRPERRRQDDAVQRHHGAAAARSWLRVARRDRRHPQGHAPAGPSRPGAHLPAPRALLDPSAADNVRVGLEASGRAAPAAAVGLLERVGVGEEAAAPGLVAPDRVGPAGRAGPRPVDRARRCSCSTSRAPVSTSARPPPWVGSSRRWRQRAAPSSWSSTTPTSCCGSAGRSHVLDFGQVIASGPPEDDPPEPGRAGGLSRPCHGRRGRRGRAREHGAGRRRHASTASTRPTGASRCCTAWICRFPAAACSRCSGPTVPERARCSRS